MSRITPLTGTDEARQIVANAGRLKDAEIHSTNDQWRLFLQNRHIGGPVWHGDVANQAAMLQLSVDSPNTADELCPNGRSVFPMDECFRIDTNSIWKCIRNRGLLIGDWLNTNISGNVSLGGIIDGGNAGDTTTDKIDGGTAGDSIVDIIDGNDPEF